MTLRGSVASWGVFVTTGKQNLPDVTWCVAEIMLIDEVMCKKIVLALLLVTLSHFILMKQLQSTATVA